MFDDDSPIDDHGRDVGGTGMQRKRDILGAPELVPRELRLSDALVASSHRDAPGRVLRRDPQQTVRLGQFS
jgi:hypothetical protein